MTVRSQFVGASGDGGVRTGGLVVGMVAVAVAFIHSRALAQETIAPDLYEVIDVGAHAYPPGVWSGASPGINNHHDVVWTAPSGLTTHAMVRFHCPRFGFPMGEVVDLTLAAGLSGLGAATDINDAGVVVGTQSSDADQGPAFVWDWTEYPGIDWTTQIPALSSLPLDFGIALGVNDAALPLIVGGSATHDWCSPAVQRSLGAFALEYRVGIAPSVADLGAHGEWLSSAASAVATSEPSPMGGYQQLCQSVQNPTFGARGLAWGWPGPFAHAELQPGSCSEVSDYCFGVNERSERVGTSAKHLDGEGDGSGQDCIYEAVIWTTPLSDPVYLPSAGGIPEESLGGVASIANAISNTYNGLTVAVGSSGAQSATEATRWVRDASAAWTASLLEDHISLMYGWNLSEATDLSADGWIAGYGWKGGVERIFLLKPIHCAGDLNGDGTTGGDDLAILYGSWGSTAASAARLDVDRNGSIGGGDLAILVSQWGQMCAPDGCVTPPPVSPALRAQCEEAICCSVGMVGFSTIEAFGAWRSVTPAANRVAVEECLACCFIAKMEVGN